MALVSQKACGKCKSSLKVVTQQSAGDILLLLDAFRPEAALDTGMYRWSRDNRSINVRIERQLRFLLLPRYWLRAADSLLTLG